MTRKWDKGGSFGGRPVCLGLKAVWKNLWIPGTLHFGRSRTDGVSQSRNIANEAQLPF